MGILLRERYGDDTKALVDVMRELAFESKQLDPDKRYRMLADLLDRHSGRPAQSMSVTGAEDEPLASILQVHIYPDTSPDGLPAKDPNKLEE